MEFSSNFNYSNKDLRGYSFKGQDLSGANFSHCNISGCDFSGAILREAKFEGIEVGINWSDITTLTIVNIILFPLWVYCIPYPADDSSEEYFSHLIRLLILSMVLAGLFTIHIVRATHEHNPFLFSIGLVFILLCLGLALSTVIKIVKTVTASFRTSFRNADLTETILNNAIYSNADLTGAIFEKAMIDA
jgi:Pentapeptide repeats (8 copies)